MQVREHILGIKARLELGLQALAGAASGNLSFTREALGDFSPLVDPLMTSPLVGDGAAYEASLQLCRSLDDSLKPFAADMAVALRLARQSMCPSTVHSCDQGVLIVVCQSLVEWGL